MSGPRPVVVASGGTGGHMFPALALVRVLEARGVASRLIVDARGARFLDPGTPHDVIPAGSPGGGPVEALRGVARLARGGLGAAAILRRARPAALAAFGGYGSVPAALAARAFRVPVLVHEQNAVLGKANRLTARFAETVALTFAETRGAEAVGEGRLRIVGNPVRAAVAQAAGGGRGADDGRFELLVTGGSQGARVFSDVVPEAVRRLSPGLRARLRVVQQCRPEDLERVRAAYAGMGDVQAECAGFFADLPERMARASLIVARSGASTVAELLALGRPALLVPYPFAADDHQAANAAVLGRAGAADLWPQPAFTPSAVAERIEALAGGEGRLRAMAEAARRLARPEAAERLADAVLALAEGPAPVLRRRGEPA